MELIKNVIIDFCLFGFWEGIIIYCFIIKFFKCNKNNKMIFVIGSLNSIITNLILPIFSHLIVIFYLSFVINNLCNNNLSIIKRLKYSGLTILSISMFEMIYSLILEIFFNIDVYSIENSFELFKYSFLLKFIEYLFIKIGGKIIMKLFVGEVRK